MNQIMPIDQLKHELAGRKKSFESMLPAHISSEKFLRTVLTAAQTAPDILKCEINSVVTSCQKAAKDGLLLDGREAALVSFRTKVTPPGGKSVWVDKAQYMPMIDGILKLARNSGEIARINAISVHENDPFHFNPGRDNIPDHNPDWFGDRGQWCGVYAFAELKAGGYVVEIMNKIQVEEIRMVSKSGTDRETGKPKGIWAKWYDRKAQVACLKRLCKRLPLSTDLEDRLTSAITHDNEEFETGLQAEAGTRPDMSAPDEKGPQVDMDSEMEKKILGENQKSSTVNTDTGEIYDHAPEQAMEPGPKYAPEQASEESWGDAEDIPI